jgi:hypothetical protein
VSDLVIHAMIEIEKDQHLALYVGHWPGPSLLLPGGASASHFLHTVC